MTNQIDSNANDVRITVARATQQIEGLDRVLPAVVADLRALVELIYDGMYSASKTKGAKDALDTATFALAKAQKAVSAARIAIRKAES